MTYVTNETPPATAVEPPSAQPSLAAPLPWEGARITTPELLSTLWIAVLLADVLRGIHETLRPGFIDELAHEGTTYGRAVTDATLLWSGFALGFLTIVVVLARILPRRANRIVNIVAGVTMIAGVLASWPKDPDDYVFGTLQVLGAALVIAICVRWRDHRLPVEAAAAPAIPA